MIGANAFKFGDQTISYASDKLIAIVFPGDEKNKPKDTNCSKQQQQQQQQQRQNQFFFVKAVNPTCIDIFRASNNMNHHHNQQPLTTTQLAFSAFVNVSLYVDELLQYLTDNNKIATYCSSRSAKTPLKCSYNKKQKQHDDFSFVNNKNSYGDCIIILFFSPLERTKSYVKLFFMDIFKRFVFYL